MSEQTGEERGTSCKACVGEALLVLAHPPGATCDPPHDRCLTARTEPAQFLDGLPWRDEGPDAPGWWWVRRPVGRVGVTVEEFVHGNDGQLRTLARNVATGPGVLRPSEWPDGWQCCPVVLP